MDSFTISQLSQFAGIKPHTIRAWEKRYHALRPGRSNGNTRHYDGMQLRRLLNIVSLLAAGYKVSELCSMPNEQLYRLLDDLNQFTKTETDEYCIAQLIAAGMNYDEAGFEKVFSNAVTQHGLKEMYRLILLPMIERVGMLWKCNRATASHEHFITNLLRQKLFAAVDGTHATFHTAEKWLLFLPENEFHEIGLLAAHNLLRLSGHQTIYLGSNVPGSALQSAIETIQPDHLLLFLVHNDQKRSTQKLLHDLLAGFSGKKIYIAGNRRLLEQLPMDKRMHCLQTVDDLANII